MGVAAMVAVVLAGAPVAAPEIASRTVTGTVLDEAGRPVSGALVTWMSTRDGTFDSFATPIPERPGGRVVETDAAGRYEVSVRRGAVAVVAVRRAQAITVRVAPVPPGDGKARVVLRFDGGTSIAGQAVDEDGRPVADARVTAIPERTGAAAGRGDAIVVRGWTGQDGRFVLAGLRPGPHRILARAPGFACTERCEYGHGMPVTSGAQDVAVVLSPGGSIRGRVVQRDGTGALRPVTSFVVSSHAFGYLEVSSPEGFFDVDVPRMWKGAPLLVLADDLAPYATNFDLLEPIALDLGQILLGPGRALRGRVRDEAGAPVAGATVSLGRTGQPSIGGAVRTDARGAFLMPRVQDGPVPLTISHPAHRTVELVTDPGAADVEVRLDSGVTLAIQVVDVGGGPLEGAKVWSVISRTSCTTDAEGRCSLTGLERREHVLEYWLAGVARAPARQIRIPIPALAAPITLRLPRRTATLRVVAMDPAGPSPNASVRVIPGEIAPEAVAASMKVPSWPYFAGGYDPEKTFEYLPPGRYTIMATTPDGRCAAPVIDLGEEDRRLEVTLPTERGGCRR